MTELDRGAGGRESLPGDPRPWSFLLRSPRDAFRLRTLLPVWLTLCAIHLGALVLPARGAWLSALTVFAAFALSLLSPWVSLGTKGALRPPPRPSLAADLRRWARSVGPLAGAAGGLLVTPALFLAIGASGTVVARLPLVGALLGALWIWTGGFALALLASAWLLVGIPALTIIGPAACMERASGYELVMRTTSYLRREPLRFLVGWVTVACGTLLGTLAFVAFLALGLLAVECFRDTAQGDFPDLRGGVTALATLCASPDLWWPFGHAEVSSALGQGASAGAPGFSHAFAPTLVVARLAPAFLVTSMLAGASRLYLVLRHRVDGTPYGGDQVPRAGT